MTAGGPGACRDDAYRSLNGTPHIPPFYAAERRLDLIRQVGVARIRKRSLDLIRRLMEQAREHGWRVHTPEHGHECSGTVTLDVPCGPEVLKKLLRSEMLVDYRPHAGIRVSPHFYKTENEVDRVIEEIATSSGVRSAASLLVRASAAKRETDSEPL